MFKTRRKLLSQNFLKDRGLIKHLVRASGVSWNDTVLEIGAGSGMITECLVSTSKKVIAIEIDEELFSGLSMTFGKNDGVELILGNFLELKLPSEPYKVFSNIPFSITSEIVKKLLFSSNPPSACNLIVQKEVAEKLLCNQRKNSMLSILFFPWFDIKVSHVFRRSDFRPAPDVDLCMLRITRKMVPLVPFHSMKKYRDFVVYKFTKSRSASRWCGSQWITAYKIDLRCSGYFEKWQSEQKKIEKIHRTRNDRSWRKW